MATLSSQSRRAKFGDVYGWLCRDLLRREPAAAGKIAILSVLGVAARVLSIGTVVLFVRARQGGSVAGFELPGADSLPTLLLYGGLTFLFALLAALTTYASEALSFAAARRYVESAYPRILDRAAAGAQVPGEASPGRALTRVLSTSMIMCLRLFVVLLTALGPMLLALVAVVVLLAINVWVTAAIGALGLILALPFVSLNRTVARASSVRELEAQATSRLASRSISTLLSIRPLTEEMRQEARAFSSHPSVQKGLDAFRDIILVRRKVNMLREIALGAALCILVVGFGLLLAGIDPAWDLVLAYLAALQRGVSGGAQAATAVTSMSRFLPQVGRYVDLMQVELPAEAPEATPIPSFRIGNTVISPSTPPSALVLPERDWTAHADSLFRALAASSEADQDSVRRSTLLFVQPPQLSAGTLEKMLEGRKTAYDLALIDGTWFVRLGDQERQLVQLSLEGLTVFFLVFSWPHSVKKHVSQAFELTMDGVLASAEARSDAEVIAQETDEEEASDELDLV